MRFSKRTVGGKMEKNKKPSLRFHGNCVNAKKIQDKQKTLIFHHRGLCTLTCLRSRHLVILLNVSAMFHYL